MTRITQAGLGFNTERNLQSAMERLATIQNKASTQKQINSPSDDPAGTATAMQVRSEQRQNDQFSRNAADAIGWLSTADATLSTTTDLLQRTRDLVLRGANDGALNQEAKNAIAMELEQLHEELKVAANTQYNGRLIFAGSSNASTAVDATNQFLDGSPVERRVGPNSTVRVDVSGSAVFGEGAESVFATVLSIAQDLRAGDSISARVAEVDTHLQAVLGEQVKIGVRHASVQTAESKLATDAVTLQGKLGSVEDIDLASTILQLKSQEVAYQAALSAASRTLQPSLMDFLR